MATKIITAKELDPDYRAYPVDEHGKYRLQYGSFVNVGAGDAGSTIEVCELPPGRVRILPYASRFSLSALGAARLMKIGHHAYNDRSTPSTADAVVEDDDAFAVGLDVSAATNAVVWSNAIKYDIFSRAGVKVFATITGGTIPDGAVGQFLLAYIYE